MTHDAGQEPARKPRVAGDEGAPYTKLIMDEVKRQRDALGWSAERLADEMTAVGVPWTRDMVVNLENGRRKSLAVHEALALAAALDVNSPLDLLAPDGKARIPVTPDVLVMPVFVREWFAGKIGPMRRWSGIFRTGLSEQVESIRTKMREGVMSREAGEQLLAVIFESSPIALRLDGEDADGEG